MEKKGSHLNLHLTECIVCPQIKIILHSCKITLMGSDSDNLEKGTLENA